MKRIFAKIQTIIHLLLQPSGPFAEGFISYEPRDKPILCYEQILYMLTFGVTIVAKVLATINNKAAYVLPVRNISIGGVILIMLLAFFNLLVPPRLSPSRITFIFVCILLLLTFKLKRPQQSR